MTSETRPQTLAAWLEYIASVHPREIELGLDRVQRVAKRMGLEKPAPVVITVAGTNGKGSTVACLEAILEQSGYRTGAYTSPHIHSFNERIRLHGEDASDADIVAALAEVDASRGADSLSYFEFATLAALFLFHSRPLDVVLLEVGLGGRLDAVNMVSADVMIITSISLDHEDWLGSDLDGIAREKAGILRSAKPAVLGMSDVPASIEELAQDLTVPLLVRQRDFSVVDATAASWRWQGVNADGAAISYPKLPLPNLAIDNVACALQALALLPLEITVATIAKVLAELGLAGRFERRCDRATGASVIVDVAHNPAAAQLLETRLAMLQTSTGSRRDMIAVLAVMADKDIEGMVSALESCLNIWYIAQIDESRSMSVFDAEKRLRDALRLAPKSSKIRAFNSTIEAYNAACETASRATLDGTANTSEEQPLVVVLGSFHTVAAVRELSTAVTHGCE